MIRSSFLLICLANAVAAQDVTTDAFGILPTESLGERANWTGLRETSTGEQMMQTAGPTDATILFVGPKSIVAGIEPGHAVALGLDIYGNMVNGAQTRFRLGYGDVVAVNTTYGIADVLFTPPPYSGVFLAGADIDDVQSARADYRVTAHLATVSPQFVEQTVPVLPETFGLISTEPLVDAYGNAVEDGVGVSIILRDAEGAATHLPSVVRDGAAQSTLLARALEGDVTGVMALAGTEAAGLSFPIEDLILEDVGDILIWEERAINAIHLRVGPLATDKGYLVPDGMAGMVEVASQTGIEQTAQSWVLDGYMSFVFLLDPNSGPFEVSLVVSGNRVTSTVEVAQPPQNATIRGAE